MQEANKEASRRIIAGINNINISMPPSLPDSLASDYHLFSSTSALLDNYVGLTLQFLFSAKTYKL